VHYVEEEASDIEVEKELEELVVEVVEDFAGYHGCFHHLQQRWQKP
jgi:CO dehydrogenase/acetyl-CoA synthase beta subunit